jgi:hypothetical protein
VIGHELAVEQAVAADLQARDEPGERHFRGVARRREHRFSEEGGAEIDAVKAADQRLTLPALDGMGMAAQIEEAIALLDLGVDPGLFAIGAAADDLGKGAVAGDGEAALAQGLPQRAGKAEPVQRQDRPPLRLNPEHLLRIARIGHRKHPDGISAKQQIGIDHRAGLVAWGRGGQLGVTSSQRKPGPGE